MYAHYNLIFEESDKVNLPEIEILWIKYLDVRHPPDVVACRWTLAHGAEDQ